MTVLVQDNYSTERINFRGWQAVLGIYLLLLIAAIMMLGELFFFHLVLVHKNMTTYDYIMAQQNSAGGVVGANGGNNESGARAALCRSGRVADESMAAAAAPKKKAKVSLNPCKALQTEKLQGDPRSWGSGASVAAKAGMAGQQGGHPTAEGKASLHGSAQEGSQPGECAACSASPSSGPPAPRAPPQLGYYPVVSQGMGGMSQAAPLYQPSPPLYQPMHGNQPLGEATAYQSFRRGQVSAYMSMPAASGSMASVVPPPRMSGSGRLPPIYSPASGRHIGTRASGDPSSPSFPSGAGQMSPSSGRYSYDGRPSPGSLGHVSTESREVSAVGNGIRHAPAQGIWRQG